MTDSLQEVTKVSPVHENESLKEEKEAVVINYVVFLVLLIYVSQKSKVRKEHRSFLIK